jgi:hypothetical protein
MEGARLRRRLLALAADRNRETKREKRREKDGWTARKWARCTE